VPDHMLYGSQVKSAKYWSCFLSHCIENWTAGTGISIWIASEQWRLAQKKVLCKQLFDESGVRYSSLNRLLYCDPVQHTVLGIMHNWDEGILQHHAWRFWGLGIDSLSDGSLHEAEPANDATTPDMAILDMDILMEDITNNEMLGDKIFDLTADSLDFIYYAQFCKHTNITLAKMEEAVTKDITGVSP
jgi:hypothetical protein